ncbi:hypothetical protein ACHWQZ_G000364 [Mnemiopsis leidyi]
MLMMNGYTSQLIESKVGLFLNEKFQTTNSSNEEGESSVMYGPDQFKVYIELPYIGDTSKKIRNCLNSCLSKIKCGSVNLRFTNRFTRLKDVFKFKDKQPAHLKSNVVYLITCSCGRKYVGETCRNVKVRFDEHVKTSGTGLTEVGKHLLDSPTCAYAYRAMRGSLYVSLRCKATVSLSPEVPRKEWSVEGDEKDMKKVWGQGMETNHVEVRKFGEC